MYFLFLVFLNLGTTKKTRHSNLVFLSLCQRPGNTVWIEKNLFHDSEKMKSHLIPKPWKITHIIDIPQQTRGYSYSKKC